MNLEDRWIPDTKSVCDNRLKNGLVIDEYGNKQWYKNNLSHREDGPAIEYPNGNKLWCINGKLHRDDGPAIEFLNGAKYWYLNGKRVAEQKVMTKYPSIASKEELSVIEQTYKDNPILTDDCWIQLFTGKKFYPLNPRPEDICIEDIAHALSMLCRFTGHCKEFYSVAQHSVIVSYFCDSSLQGLLHDASEAYISDINSPIKKMDQLTGYREIESKIQKVIYKKFNLPEIENTSVKKADKLVLAIEARNLMNHISPEWNIPSIPLNIIPLPPKEAEQLFLNRYKELTK